MVRLARALTATLDVTKYLPTLVTPPRVLDGTWCRLLLNKRLFLGLIQSCRP